MKRYFTALILCTLSLSSQLARADIIDDAIGNIQQAINDAYNPAIAALMTTTAMMTDVTGQPPTKHRSPAAV